MKNLLIVANWKSNIAKLEAKKWLESFSMNEFPENLEIIVLPPFTLLDIISGYIRVNDLNIKLGSQDVSPFDKGAYTGEVNAQQIKEFADYVLIGHSERRTNFSESDKIINQKIEESIKIGLKPIVCISNLDQVRSLNTNEIVIAYEPLEAIGTGYPENPDSVSAFVAQIKQIKNTKIIYGGSVSADNIINYISLPEIDGVLVGGASLDSSSFVSLVKNVV